MSIHLISNERILWQSFPGVRYRTFVFTRDIMLFVFMSIIFYFGIQDFLPGVVNDRLLLYLSIGLVILGVIFAAVTQIQFLLIRYYLTSDRLIIQKGFFNRKLTSIKLEHVHDTKVHQSFAERLLKTGSIYVFTANDSIGTESGTEDLHLVPAIKFIDEPFLIHQQIEETLEQNSK